MLWIDHGPEKARERVAVLSVVGYESSEGIALVHGINDRGEELLISVGAALLSLAPFATFEELGVWA